MAIDAFDGHRTTTKTNHTNVQKFYEMNDANLSGALNRYVIY